MMDETKAELRADRQGATKGGDPVSPMHPDPHTSTSPAVETPVEARQGYAGRPVALVLTLGLVFAVVAGIALLYFVR